MEHAVLNRVYVMLLSTALAFGGQSCRATADAGERKKKVRREPLILVMNYPYQITGSAKTKIHVTLFKPDFKPAAGAVVKVNGKMVGKADENGTCIFDYVPGANKSHKLVATLRQDKTKYRVRKSFASNARTASFRSDQLFVYTDRGVYNPGDDILVRLLAWELLADYTAIPGAEISLFLEGAGSGKSVAGTKVKTNKFGVASTKIPLPDNMEEGNFQLVVLYKQARETARLRIERFVPPLIEVKHNLKRFLTAAQDHLDVKVDVAYFAGGKPASSTLKLEVQDAAKKELFSKTFKETSPATFEFTLSSKELDRIRGKLTAEQAFRMVLRVTDNFDRTSATTRDVVFTQRPFRAVLEFDKDDYPTGETVKLQAKVADLDGKPAKGIKLTCTVGEMKVKVDATTDDKGVAEFSFKMGKNAGTAVVTSPVMPVPLAQKAVRLNAPKPMTSKVHEPPDKQGVQVRFNVTFDPKYVPVEKVVHIDFTDLSGGLVTSTTIPISETEDGGHKAEGTVTADTWGTMLANLYVAATERKNIRKKKKLSVKNVGFITEGQHVTLYPDAEATITVKNLKPRVKPGEKAVFEVEVKTKSGQEAALGASMVDGAVLSLLDPLEVTPSDHFYNPQRKVISTGGAGVLTWPVVDRNWGSPWRDIAYCNWGFKGPGGMVKDSRDDSEMEGAGGIGAGSGGSGGVAMGKASPGAPMKKMSKSKVSMVMMDASIDGEMAAPMEEAMDEDAEPSPDMAKESSRRRNGKGKKKQKKRPQITIRTEFPETALWEPLLTTKNGKATIKVDFPDSITVQRLTLMASDKVGGVGLLHEDIEVRQDLFVQSDLPATMTLGDQLTVGALVRNMSGKDVSLVATLQSDDFVVLGLPAQPVQVADQGTGVVTWAVKPAKCGANAYRVTVANDAYEDTEEKKVFVRPAGNPSVTVESGTLSSRQSFSAEVKFNKGAAYRTVFLNASFPNIIPALQGFEAVQELPFAFIGVSGLANQAILDAALLEWGIQADRPSEWIDALKARLGRAAAQLVAAQDEDGGWGWWYLPDSSSNRGGYTKNVYLTALALKALTEVKLADLGMQDEAVVKAAEYIMSARNKEGLWAPGGACFWEKNAPETDWALSGDLFGTVSAALASLGKKPSKELKGVSQKLQKYLAERPEEASAVAHITAGLVVFARWQKDKKLKGKLEKAVKYLLTLKRQGYWEPHWYHAYGGTVELNATILDMIHALNSSAHESVQRELVTYLLSTREAWGAWHNEMGTVTAIKALLKAGAGTVKEVPSTVTVQVNGKTVSTVKVDPADPFLSAAKLRYLKLTGHLKDGANEVTVSYDGKLRVPVMLEIREWKSKGRGAPKGMSRAPGLSLERSAPGKAQVGEPVEVNLTLNADRKGRLVQVTDSIPSNMEIDKKSVEKLALDKKVATYKITDDAVTFLIPEVSEELVLTYKLVATREGTSQHAGATAKLRFDSKLRPATVVGDEIVVSL